MTPCHYATFIIAANYYLFICNFQNVASRHGQVFAEFWKIFFAAEDYAIVRKRIYVV